MLYGNIIVSPDLKNLRDESTRMLLEKAQTFRAHNPLPALNIKGFMETVVDTTLSSGARALLQLAGMR